MKNLIIISLLFLVSCGAHSGDTQNESVNNEQTKAVQESFKNIAQEQDIAIDSFMVKAIDKKYIITKGELNDKIMSLSSSNLSLYDGLFNANLLVGKDSLIVINNTIEGKVCTEHMPFLLKKNKEGNWEDVFESYFPDISLYSFYDFGDKKVSQLEGDEQTVFAGYLLHTNKKDSIGIQFMFCNQKDSADTKKLNENGKVNYYPI